MNTGEVIICSKMMASEEITCLTMRSTLSGNAEKARSFLLEVIC